MEPTYTVQVIPKDKKHRLHSTNSEWVEGDVYKTVVQSFTAEPAEKE